MKINIEKSLIFIFLFIYFNLNHADVQSAVNDIKPEIVKTPNDYKYHFDLGLAKMAFDDYENALKAFNRVLELNSDYTLAKYKIAMIYYAMDSFKVAKSKFEELLEIFPENRVIYERLGLIYGTLGEYEKMLQTFQSYADETDYEFTLERGIASAFLRNYSDAINYYKKIVSQYQVEIQLAMIYHNANDTVQANKWLKKSLKHFSSSNPYYGSSKSVYCYRLGKYDKAIAIVDQLIDQNKTGPHDYYNRGVVRIASGDADGLVNIKEACDMDTSYSFAQAIYNAIIAIRSDSLIKAEYYLKQRIRGLRRSGIAKGLLAWTLDKLGKDSEANKYWFMCYGQLPLGTDVESMRNFIDNFIQTIKEAK